jgi:hypothetical protein
LLRLHCKRWGIACGPHDTKDPRLRLGIGSIPAGTPGRRDRPWLSDRAAFDPALLSALKPGEPAMGVVRNMSHN